MLKTNSTHEWVEAAIACGYDPKIIPAVICRAPRVECPHGWLATNHVDVNRDRAPEAYPNDWCTEIRAKGKHEEMRDSRTR